MTHTDYLQNRLQFTDCLPVNYINDSGYSPISIHKVWIGNRLFRKSVVQHIKLTVTSFLSFVEDIEDRFMKIQTYFDNLVNEPSKKVNYKLRYEALKIIGEKITNLSIYMFIDLIDQIKIMTSHHYILICKLQIQLQQFQLPSKQFFNT